ncbi:MAG: hypothetical protein AAF495_27275 [Pseudomonadota bacterium]
MRYISGLVTVIVASLILSSVARAGDLGIERPQFASSTHCKSAFETYAGELKPMYFVVAEQGNFCLYSFCRDACSKANAKNNAVVRCEQTSGQNCRVYAAYGQIVAPGLI